MRPLAILVAGDLIADALVARGSFADMIRATVGDAWPGSWLEVDGRTLAELPAFEPLAGLIITGSPASVASREPWILRLEGYLSRAVPSGLPTFGIASATSSWPKGRAAALARTRAVKRSAPSRCKS